MKQLYRIILLSLMFCHINLHAKTLEKISLQLQWLDQYQFAGYYIAKEKGFYEEVGLDVQINKYKYGINTIDEVMNQKSTYGIGRSSLIIDKSKGKGVVIINAIFQSSPLVLLALKDSKIKTVEDFFNKRIMSTSDASSTASMYAMMNRYGINEYDMIMQKHSFDINDLINKKTDLMASYTSNELFILKEKGIEHTVFDPKDYGFDLYSDILFTSAHEAKNNPQRVVRFSEATLRGWKYAFEHIDETIKLIQSKYNSQKKSYKALEHEATTLKQLAYYKTEKLGDINVNKVKRIFDLYNVLGLVEQKIDMLSLLFDANGQIKLDLNDKEIAYLKEHPVIKVHNETNWPPFNFNVNKEARGFSIDYINLLAKKLNIKVEFISGYSWNEFMKMLPSSDLDLIINIAKNDTRAKTIAFTSSFFNVKNAIYVNQNNQIFNDVNDLIGKTIAMPKGFFTQKFFEKYYPDIKQILVKDSLEALKMLSLGKVDATIGKKVVMDYIIENNAISNVLVGQFLEDERTVSHIRLGASKEDQILIDILQKVQNSLKYNEVQKLRAKWFSVKTKLNGKRLQLSQKEKAYLYTKKEVTVCVQKDWLPYEGYDHEKFIGISADFIRLYMKRLALDVNVIVAKDSMDYLDMLKNRRCDIKPMIGAYIFEEKPFVKTQNYLHDSVALVTRMEQPFIQDLATLNQTVLTIKGNKRFNMYIEKKYPNLTIDKVENINAALDMVANKKAFGYLGTSLVASNYIQEKYSNELKIVNSYVRFDYGLGVIDSDPMLYEVVKKSMDATSKDQKRKILNSWVATTVDKKVDYMFLWQMVGVVMVLLAIFIYKIILTSKHNTELEKQKNIVDQLNKNLELRVKEEVHENQLKDQQLFEQSRFAQMGEMIGMIAHQWRQPLAAISSTTINLQIKLELEHYNLSLIKDQEKCVHYFKKELADIEDYVHVLTHTIDDFRNFYKPNKEANEVNIKEPIVKALKIIKASLISDDITLIEEYHSKTELKLFDSELMQVFLNIIKNAQDNFKSQDIPKKEILIRTTDESEGIKIMICDNGGGIDQNVVPKIFDPYFSTKDKKNGTGLGLYMSKIIIEEHHKGTINVHNIENQACFEIVINNIKS
ncbi:MAG: transporter substrate-binding domain-containing protein [Campylobacterota bacterium]|nr:transporter substrate-binding domain-containing protein [Campylobacterota bacterium]